MAKKKHPDGTETFKCARCNYVSNDSIRMRDHINEVHGGSGYNLYSRIKSTKPAKKRDASFLWYGVAIGLIVGYIAGYTLGYFLGLLGSLLYAFLFMLALSYAREYDSKFLRSFGIGGFGIILGFIIDAIIGYGAKKGTAYRILVFIIGTGIVMIVIMLIYAIELSVLTAQST